MIRTTAKYLRFHVREILNAARRGEEIVVTWRGKPCAKVVGLGDEGGRGTARNPAFGIWRDRPEAVQEQVDRLRAAREL